MTDFSFRVEAGHLLTYARAIGDPDPVYLDDEAVADGLPGVTASPTFVHCSAQFDPGYPLRIRPERPWHGSGRNPSGADLDIGAGSPTVLHAEQHFEYHLPCTVGLRLTVTRRAGETWTKTRRSGETLVFREEVSEFRDAAGRLIVTARQVVAEIPAAVGP